MTINSISVFEWEIDWAAQVNGRFEFDIRDSSIGFGPEIIDPKQAHVAHGFDFTVDFRDDEIDEIETFCDALKGKATPFYLPGPVASFRISDSVEGGQVLILDQGAVDNWQAHPGAMLYFRHLTQNPIAAKITAVEHAEGGQELLTIAVLSGSGTIDEDWQCFPLYLVRFTDDNEKVDVCAERWQRRTFKVIEIPTEYEAEESPTEPVYTYRFTAGDTVWKFTSHPEDVDNEWLAVGIEHNRFTRSMKLGGTVTITADVDEVEPLRLLLPMRLSRPLMVEILRDGVVEFTGYARKPEIKGRSISVSCVEWGDALEQQVPAFFIQRQCNYRVYDTNTCRAVKASFQVAVTITAKNGRTLTVTGAGLAGKVENWFALGWIEIGSGVAAEKLYILSSAAAVGTSVTLTTSLPMNGETPVSAVMIPGCDNNRSTCIAKFDNLVNFGGHATPRENLTFEAIQLNTSTGKK